MVIVDTDVSKWCVGKTPFTHTHTPPPQLTVCICVCMALCECVHASVRWCGPYMCWSVCVCLCWCVGACVWVHNVHSTACWPNSKHVWFDLAYSDRMNGVWSRGPPAVVAAGPRCVLTPGSAPDLTLARRHVHRNDLRLRETITMETSLYPSVVDLIQ